MGRQTAGIQEQDTQFKGIGEHGKQEFSQKDQLSLNVLHLHMDY